MTYETLDTALTTILTATIYGGALCFFGAFIVFVACRDLSDAQAIAVEQINAVEPEALAALEVSESPILDDNSTVTSDSALTIATAPISKAPVDFSLWRVADLRSSKLREALGVPLREGRRLYRKAELIAFYQQAIAV